MWTDTYKTTSEDYFIPSDRSDSGITSPYNQQHSDDFTHCDLPVWWCLNNKNNFIRLTFNVFLFGLQSIERIQHDDIRKRILVMTKKPCLDEEDKVCLLQIFSLLTNLEAMSQEQNMASVEDASLGYDVSCSKL